jgi:hypothetical protein
VLLLATQVKFQARIRCIRLPITSKKLAKSCRLFCRQQPELDSKTGFFFFETRKQPLQSRLLATLSLLKHTTISQVYRCIDEAVRTATALINDCVLAQSLNLPKICFVTGGKSSFKSRVRVPAASFFLVLHSDSGFESLQDLFFWGVFHLL